MVLSPTYILHFSRGAGSSGGGSGGSVARFDDDEEEGGCSPSLSTPSCPTPGHAPAQVSFQMGRWHSLLQELYYHVRGWIIFAVTQ